MATSQFRKDAGELYNILMTMALIGLPAVIAYYFCRDYPGRGNSPANAPFAAFVLLLVWTPFYLGLRQLFPEWKNILSIILLVIFVMLTLLVTVGNPKF